MLAQQRQQAILRRVRKHGAARVAELVRDLGVSDMTIRRDLEVLAEQGLVEKVHGGATAVGAGSTEEPGFAAKSMRQQAEKEAIARRAAELAGPGTAVALSAGTTTWTLAHHLAEVPKLTVITNSPRVADVFHHGRQDQTVVLTGGVRTPSDALVGPVAVAAVRSLNVDTLMLGVHGMSTRAGFSTPNMLEAETDRELVAAAQRLVVLADHTKWGTVGFSTIARLEEADVVVSDTGLPDDAREALAERVGTLILAEPAADENDDEAVRP
ncbi:DeoR/GlpR family DNA-binding transcription regulator [Sphaerisporangium rubeum]|uniref:DeoR/GlpR family transcriptional regulator of sugar metabolism n=1 Tax=Sphaerisporangium rubeum TaxID=321317 RepID=A0A7X0M8D1_9ACTN|nr:DeoR/GlpR family DNA-binding transcription regulator [Sphaerisporangium rubeum]MBB6475247.1 DeoR/GlpR family transcriptional regulator of sugar metabolism [Sphaerisporangium rubeum]